MRTMYLVGSDVPVLVRHEFVLQLRRVLKEVLLVAGLPQNILDPLALPGIRPLASQIVLRWIFRSFCIALDEF